MPYFSERGYDCYALSLRGQAGAPSLQPHARTPPHRTQLSNKPDTIRSAFLDPQGASDLAPGTAAGGVSGTLQEHAADVTDFLRSLPAPAVLVGHSFGGLVVQEVLTRPPPSGAAQLAGLALLASVPPQGNGPMVARFLRTKPIVSLKARSARRRRHHHRRVCASDIASALLLSHMRLRGDGLVWCEFASLRRRRRHHHHPGR